VFASESIVIACILADTDDAVVVEGRQIAMIVDDFTF